MRKVIAERRRQATATNEHPPSPVHGRAECVVDHAPRHPLRPEGIAEAVNATYPDAGLRWEHLWIVCLTDQHDSTRAVLSCRSNDLLARIAELPNPNRVLRGRDCRS